MASRQLDDALLCAALKGRPHAQAALDRQRVRSTGSGLSSAAVGLKATLEDLQRRGIEDSTAIYATVRALADEIHARGEELESA